eukprot:5213058-Alexandrium_andersonii.AAC.1
MHFACSECRMAYESGSGWSPRPNRFCRCVRYAVPRRSGSHVPARCPRPTRTYAERHAEAPREPFCRNP